MSRGVNKAIIVGTLGKDPEIRYTANGGAVANISVATNEEWKDKQTGAKQTKTEWHRLVCFGKLAEICQQYLKKGSQAYFEGSIETRKWQDQSGNDRYSTEIKVREMQMLGGKPAHDNSDHRQQPATKPQQQQAPMDRDGVQTGADDDGFTDPIPF